MKALIVTLLPLFIRFFFFGCFDLALPSLPGSLSPPRFLLSIASNNLNFSNPLGIGNLKQLSTQLSSTCRQSVRTIVDLVQRTEAPISDLES